VAVEYLSLINSSNATVEKKATITPYGRIPIPPDISHCCEFLGQKKHFNQTKKMKAANIAEAIPPSVKKIETP
jgi:hypothetical protein